MSASRRYYWRRADYRPWRRAQERFRARRRAMLAFAALLFAVAMAMVIGAAA